MQLLTFCNLPNHPPQLVTLPPSPPFIQAIMFASPSEPCATKYLECLPFPRPFKAATFRAARCMNTCSRLLAGRCSPPIQKWEPKIGSRDQLVNPLEGAVGSGFHADCPAILPHQPCPDQCSLHSGDSQSPLTTFFPSLPMPPRLSRASTLSIILWYGHEKLGYRNGRRSNRLSSGLYCSAWYDGVSTVILCRLME